ncbi:MAG: nucleoside triphosphate pyrophosphohydrolase [Bacteroidetes bacterium]|nr:nucleoside triphosphate pyrophosphohydrolase [Bacteroidota bacterium]MCW5894484.1 nucleoside triphosphate pyrophosphohydrolase [Bacteroidota bacterium]
MREIAQFIAIVRRLRDECPWDRQQTHQSIRHSLIEETYEVIEALDENNLDELKIELGDLLLHIVMHATIAEQGKEFSLKDVLEKISDKLVRRHPHVFGTRQALDAREVKRNWERLKMAEGRSSLLDGVPKSLPALQRALRVQERAAKVGFDWKNEHDVWAKVREEGEELQEALKRRKRKKQEEEFGDYLFALVNYARFVGIEPETALRLTVEKFTKRFQYIERELKRMKKDIHDSTLEEMDGLWNEAKRKKLSSRTSSRKTR